MGINYTVLPLVEEQQVAPFFHEDHSPLAEMLRAGQLFAWLENHKIDVTAVEKSGRFPTPNEMKQMLDGLDDFKTTYHSGFSERFGAIWQANISDAVTFIDELSTLLNVLNFNGNADEPQRIFFEKGAPWLNLYILEKFSQVCGPLLVIPDDIGVPILVQPGVSPDAAVDVWKKVWDRGS